MTSDDLRTAAIVAACPFLQQLIICGGEKEAVALKLIRSVHGKAAELTGNELEFISWNPRPNFTIVDAGESADGKKTYRLVNEV